MTGLEAQGDSEGRLSSTYRLSRAHVARAVGPLSLALGVSWLLMTLLEASAPVRLTWALGTAALVGLCVLLFLRPPAVLRLTSDGFRVGFVRGADAKQASWPDVASVETSPVSGAVSLVLSLHDGRTSIVPLSLLGDRQEVAQQDVHERLNTAHGYRRLPPS